MKIGGLSEPQNSGRLVEKVHSVLNQILRHKICKLYVYNYMNKYCLNQMLKHSRFRGYKTFFMLNSAELEFYSAHKC